MIEARVGKNLETGLHGAAFRISASINDPGNARLDNGARAHAARFHRNVQSRAAQSIVAQHSCAFAEHDHFGVRSGVTVQDSPIAGTRDHFSFVNQDGAYRNLAGSSRTASFLYSAEHELRISSHVPEHSTHAKALNISRQGPLCLTILLPGNKLLRMVEHLARVLRMPFACISVFVLSIPYDFTHPLHREH
jgi:hypothetical protein